MGEIIAVTGKNGSVGATTTTVLLGGGTGERRRDTGILDVTIEGTRVSDVLDLSPDDRLPSVLRGELPLREFKQEGPHGLSIYAASDAVSWDGVTAEGVESLYDRLRNRHELTFVDCDTPGTPTSSLWLAHADRLVIVTDSVDVASDPMDALESGELEAAADAFDSSIAGTVVNRADDPERVLDAVAPEHLLAVLPEDPAAAASADAGQTPYRYDPDSPLADTGWRLAGQFDDSSDDRSVELPGGTVEPDEIATDPSERASDDSPDATGTNGNGESAVSVAPDGTATDDRAASETDSGVTTTPPDPDDAVVAGPPGGDGEAEQSEPTASADDTTEPEPLGAPEEREIPHGTAVSDAPPTADEEMDDSSNSTVLSGVPDEAVTTSSPTATDSSESPEDPTAAASPADSLNERTDRSGSHTTSPDHHDDQQSGDSTKGSMMDDSGEGSMAGDDSDEPMAGDSTDEPMAGDDTDEPLADGNTDEVPGDQEDVSEETDAPENTGRGDAAFEFDTAVESRDDSDSLDDSQPAAAPQGTSEQRSTASTDVDGSGRETDGLRDRVESLASETMTVSLDVEESAFDAEELSELSDEEIRSLLVELGVPGEIPEHVSISFDTLDHNGVPPAVSDPDSSVIDGSTASRATADEPAADDTSGAHEGDGGSSDPSTSEGDSETSARNIRSVVEVIVEDTEAKREDQPERTVRIPAEEIDDGGIPIDIQSATDDVDAALDAGDVRMDEETAAALLDDDADRTVEGMDASDSSSDDGDASDSPPDEEMLVEGTDDEEMLVGDDDDDDSLLEGDR